MESRFVRDIVRIEPMPIQGFIRFSRIITFDHQNLWIISSMLNRVVTDIILTEPMPIQGVIRFGRYAILGA